MQLGAQHFLLRGVLKNKTIVIRSQRKLKEKKRKTKVLITTKETQHSFQQKSSKIHNDHSNQSQRVLLLKNLFVCNFCWKDRSFSFHFLDQLSLQKAVRLGLFGHVRIVAHA